MQNQEEMGLSAKKHWQRWEILKPEQRWGRVRVMVVWFVQDNGGDCETALPAVWLIKGGQALTSSPSSPPGMHISESLSDWSHACSGHLQEKKKKRKWESHFKFTFATLGSVMVKCAASHFTNLSLLPPPIYAQRLHAINFMSHNASVASLFQ